jgi:hypothetical protein
MLDSLIGEMMGHWCNGRSIVPADDPMSLKVGWVCLGCGKGWEIRLCDIKVDTGCYKEMLCVIPEGRKRLQEIINHGGWCLVVWDEEELPI